LVTCGMTWTVFPERREGVREGGREGGREGEREDQDPTRSVLLPSFKTLPSRLPPPSLPPSLPPWHSMPTLPSLATYPQDPVLDGIGHVRDDLDGLP
jgi:hypothetical protein